MNLKLPLHCLVDRFFSSSFVSFLTRGETCTLSRRTVYAVCIHEYIQQSVWVNIMRRYVGVRFFYPLFKKYSAGARCDEGVVKLGLYGSLFGCVCFLNPLCRHFSLLSERCPNGSPLFARQALFPVDRFGILCLIESLTP